MTIMYEMVDGELTEMVEVCECGVNPQSPWYDQCIHCGQVRDRHYEPAKKYYEHREGGFHGI